MALGAGVGGGVGGGGDQKTFQAFGALLNAPVHSEHWEHTQVRRITSHRPKPSLIAARAFATTVLAGGRLALVPRLAKLLFPVSVGWGV